MWDHIKPMNLWRFSPSLHFFRFGGAQSRSFAVSGQAPCQLPFSLLRMLVGWYFWILDLWPKWIYYIYTYIYIYKLNFHDMNIIIIYIYILIYLIHINSIEVPCASICTTLVVATIWILSQGSPAVFCRMIIQQIASKMRPAVQQPRIPNNPFLRVHRQKHCTNSVRHKWDTWRRWNILQLTFDATPGLKCVVQRTRTQSPEFQFVFALSSLFDTMLGLSYRLPPKMKTEKPVIWHVKGMHSSARHLLAVSLRPLHRRTVLAVTQWPLIIAYPQLPWFISISPHHRHKLGIVGVYHQIKYDPSFSGFFRYHGLDEESTPPWSAGAARETLPSSQGALRSSQALDPPGQRCHLWVSQHEILSNRVGAENSNQCIPVYWANGTSIDGIRGNKDYDVGSSKIQWNTGIP